jgi:hypothetical protein
LYVLGNRNGIPSGTTGLVRRITFVKDGDDGR